MRFDAINVLGISSIVIVFVLLVLGITFGFIKNERENKNIINCKKTDMYIIGNKGRAARVYDCGAIEL